MTFISSSFLYTPKMILQTATQFELYQQPPFCPRSEGIQGRAERFNHDYSQQCMDPVVHLCWQNTITFVPESHIPLQEPAMRGFLFKCHLCLTKLINRGICLHFTCSLLYVSDLRGLHNPAQHCDSLQGSTIFSLISSYLRNAAAHSGETSFIVLYKGLYIFPSWKALLQHSYL